MTRDDITNLVIDEVKKLSVDERLCICASNANLITIEQLRIDSLEMIEWAMNIESRLGIEFEVTVFPKNASLAELADYLFSLKNNAVKNLS